MSPPPLSDTAYEPPAAPHAPEPLPVAAWMHPQTPENKHINEACRAVRFGDVDALRRACKEHKVPAESTDATGRRLLSQAALCGHVDVLKVLVEELGAEVDARSDWKLNGQVARGSTALLAAANNDSFEALKYLISKGANLEARAELHNEFGHHRDLSAFLMASAKGHRRIVEYLVSVGADRHAALSFDVCQALSYGGVAGPHFSGLTAVHYAAFSQDGDMIRYLVKGLGLDPNAKDSIAGVAPIHMSAFLIDVDGDSLQALVEVGADLNARSLGAGAGGGTGDSALHVAARFGRPRAVRVLLANGADPTIRNFEGRTPAEVAVGEETIAALREFAAGAEPGQGVKGSAAGAADEAASDIAEVEGEEAEAEAEADQAVPPRVSRRLDPAVVKAAAQNLTMWLMRNRVQKQLAQLAQAEQKKE